MTGVTYDGNALTMAISHQAAGAAEDEASIWYLINPTTSSSLAVEITHTGKTTDSSATAFNLSGVDTGDVIDLTDTDTVTATTSTVTVASVSSTVIAPPDIMTRSPALPLFSCASMQSGKG